MKHIILLNIIGLIIIFLYIVYVLDTVYDRITPRINNLYIKNSPLGGKYGRGVFTANNINTGDIIEIVPYIEDNNDSFTGVVRDYVFTKNTQESNTSSRGAIPFGFAVVYNHMDDPNARWYFEDKFFIIKAIKPIQQGEEIFISYGPGYWDTRSIEKL
jgi:SET domain-containing protein